ncbi:MAG TPA: pyridoxamine 5'-phosphate oxidase family protein [Opitutus sp.]|nr:pyridoxamine 5'-phosphate oxidase family protein [Opitutus sp.]
MNTPNTTQGRAEALNKLRDLINDINFAMLTTVAADGSLRSRPMATLQFDTETGELWFFTAQDSPKADEIAEEHQVGVSYASPGKQDYVSISGRARIVRDQSKMAELWTPMAKLWFPKGLDDPRLALLRVEIEAAEYWDSPSGMMVGLYGLAKLAITGKPPKHTGENVKIDLPLKERARY